MADAPHQRGHISNHAATMAEVLGAEGYAMFCAGQWHLAPVFVQNVRLLVDYNAFGDHTIIESDVPVPEGSSTLKHSRWGPCAATSGHADRGRPPPGG